jgi:hypothetical protein
MVREGEGTGSPLAGTIAAIARLAGFVAVGCDRDRSSRWPLCERPEAARRQRSRDRKIARLDLLPMRQRDGGGRLDALSHQQVWHRRRIAPQHRASGSALIVFQPRRFLRVASPAAGIDS